MHISGDYFHAPFSIRESYYFSRYPHIWGWATWRRAWLNYDSDLNDWALESTRKDFLKQFPNPAERRFWKHTFDAVRAGTINTWDFQWVFACMMQGGLAINPQKNLVSNIGFGDLATHTADLNNKAAQIPTAPLELPLIHPDSLSHHGGLDEQTAKMFFLEPIFIKQIYYKFRWHISRIRSANRK